MKLKKIIESMEDDARKYAEKAHEGQTRKSGGPYVAHPKRVAEIVRRYKSSSKINDLISAALLHDTIEDTNTTEEDLKKMFNGLVASLVNELSTDKQKAAEKGGKKEYLADKMTNKLSSWALVIKLADRLDNVSDLKTSDPKFAKRYKEETEFILNKLKKERKLSGTQKRLISEIEKKLKELD